jgi:hypothetical protein
MGIGVAAVSGSTGNIPVSPISAGANALTVTPSAATRAAR